ncbi:hypothetical protein TGAMA5MH_02363 [Trichoderma gamsii]|uniref:Uncharacterized protein n=1 Tax=Trichoderma gamsii TaxID=398673 RepID=A0A2K0TLC4_9HYPO|nr:hypothetical protein TGAMA5MH_02363 [Trichoderma gamsii]
MYHSGSVPQEEPKPKPPSQQTWASLDVGAGDTGNFGERAKS